MTKNRIKIMEKTRMAIQHWWARRLQDGCQLTDPDSYLDGFDYCGSARWKEWVSVSALQTDFEAESGIKCHVSVFTRGLLSHTNLTVESTRRRIRMGRTDYRPMISIIRFNKRRTNNP